MMKNEESNISIINHFDPAKAQKAHGDTILASAVLPAGLHSPFDHAWGYLNGPGRWNRIYTTRKKYTSSQRDTALSLWMRTFILWAREM